MGYLLDGLWHGGDDRQIGAKGWEPRQEQFKGHVRAAEDGPEPEFRAEAGRYHLIVCPGCPLSHRVAMLREIKGLAAAISQTVVRPVMGENGREFGTIEGTAVDPVTGRSFLHQVYTDTLESYSGRASTPVLWDRTTGRIVSNTYRDIFTMLNCEFDAFADARIDLRPPDLRDEIESELADLSASLLGAVYRCGFSRDQAEYERYAAAVDAALPRLSEKLADRPFLLGDRITEPDLALVANLVRYDAIYLPLFRCTRRRVEDHPALTRYVRRILAMPRLRETFDLTATMTHYFVSHAHINPTRVVPLPPRLSWLDGPRAT